MASESAAFAGQDHDHGECVSGALRAAEVLCGDRGTRLTELRRRVLEILWESHRPVGAYAILETLGRTAPVAPPTVYRALEFLQEQGLVHRIASLNAFIGCARPGTAHVGQFLICGTCRESTEVDDPRVMTALRDSAERAGFRVGQHTVEMIGVCPRCRREAGDGRNG